ncbi:ABC transporter ATP-binding protein [Flavobacteriaceae bacterium]|nr:ABC transporter ATP-binding protein [Flavobacteriaceae bacterium]
MDDREVILKVENISKQYRLGLVGTGTLSHDFNRWWHRIRGKEDPYLKIGETNDRSIKGESEYVWALRDINFEVRRGEVLGIIGKNGAGKSTLLKILSRVTSPTTGSIKTKGRIASLLEVGTGFHGEMTGRENIYLNGAILGMTKKEITAKIDEIIEFSGCERYIDTPVKRYSSGMTVRLAFAVAAFLEPDILIVDEVLAVGDAEFQKKAIGKMQDISSGEGRTVLFVSHNIVTVESITNRCALIEKGKFSMIDKTELVVNKYLSKFKIKKDYTQNIVNQKNQIIKIALSETNSNENSVHYNDPIIIFVEGVHDLIENIVIGIAVKNNKNMILFTDHYSLSKLTTEHFSLLVEIPSGIMNPGSYSIDVALFSPNRTLFEYLDNVIDIRVVSINTNLYGNNKNAGSIYVKCKWNEI